LPAKAGLSQAEIGRERVLGRRDSQGHVDVLTKIVPCCLHISVIIERTLHNRRFCHLEPKKVDVLRIHETELVLVPFVNLLFVFIPFRALGFRLEAHFVTIAELLQDFGQYVL
jgi:hypothetical protein